MAGHPWRDAGAPLDRGRWGPGDADLGGVAGSAPGTAVVAYLAGRRSDDPGSRSIDLRRFDAVWTADGKRVAYSSERLGRAPAIYWKPSDGSGEEEELTHGDYPRFVQDASRDGKLLAFTELNPETGWDIWVLPLEGSRQPVPFLRTPFAEAEPTFSPDGRWLAYTSNESGRFEVYARPYPGPGIKVQISTAGGVEPLWSKDGRELFYRSGQRVMSASVRLSPELTAGTPQVLFESPSPYDTDPEFRQYDLAADGRFLMIREMAGPRPPDHLRLVVGWRSDLARRVPN